MTYQHTNREQLESKIGKKNANRLEFRIGEICKLAEELKIHVILDYETQDSQLKVVVKKDPEIQFEEVPKGSNMDEYFKKSIIEVLNQTDWNKRRAAEVLGISERTLYKKIKEYGLKN